ncbi:helix-turn-helix domain-containing protein [Streptomyces sp. G1]|uniref:helix-turn-helix domain-containing protein n=1 Tax=Streptomyces sp. G1 TaxID=361572 RepID=UPI00202F9708|nr:helix-turn-helix domain-containing protein [Streptomyces sp. G1]MCM1966564.1 helix-turn-helix domain-containing protein [Streptomyces sp. G1]
MTLPAECGHLAAELRRLRRRTGLSLVDLGRCTPYSKSSWERYLNGKQQPPRQAVEVLCAVAREHPGRLLALWELADAVWSGRAVPASPRAVPVPGARSGAAGSDPAPAGPAFTGPAPAGPVPAGSAPAAERAPVPGGRRRRLVLTGSVLGGVLLVLTAALLLLRESGPRQTGDAGPAEKMIRNPGCAGAGCAGKDPVRMGCGGAGMVTALRTDTGPGDRQLELRYGALCEAVWVRASGLKPGDRVEVIVPGVADPQEVRAGDLDVGKYVATPMVPVPRGTAGIRSCVTPGQPAAEARVCFG